MPSSGTLMCAYNKAPAKPSTGGGAWLSCLAGAPQTDKLETIRATAGGEARKSVTLDTTARKEERVRVQPLLVPVQAVNEACGASEG